MTVTVRERVRERARQRQRARAREREGVGGWGERERSSSLMPTGGAGHRGARGRGAARRASPHHVSAKRQQVFFRDGFMGSGFRGQGSGLRVPAKCLQMCLVVLGLGCNYQGVRDWGDGSLVLECLVCDSGNAPPRHADSGGVRVQEEGAIHGAGSRAPVHDLRRNSLCAPPVRGFGLSVPEGWGGLWSRD